MYSIVFAALCFLFFLLICRKIDLSYRSFKEHAAFARQHGCLPAPAVRNNRPWGVDRIEELFRSDKEGCLMEQFMKHFRFTGHTIEQNLVGAKAFNTIEPANLEALLSSRSRDFDLGLRRKLTIQFFGDGIFVQEGPAWKHSREVLRLPLQYRNYEDLACFKPSVDTFIDIVSNSDQPIDLQPLFFRLTLDVTTSYLFGESVQSLKQSKDGEESLFNNAFNTAQDYVTLRMRLPDFYRLIGGQKFRDSCDYVHDFANRIIDRNLAKPRGERDTFLTSLAEQVKDRKELLGQVINLLVAGRDSTACLLSWTFFLLVRYPAVLEKLRGEIKAAGLDYENLRRLDLKKIEYLNFVLKESLRLYPPVPINTRTANKTTMLPTGGGPDRTAPVMIPKGVMVGFSIYAMHRRPDLYGMDAELFRPERWGEKMPLHDCPQKTTWGFLPFNGGPRTCMGMDFAMTEAAYTVVRLLHHFPNIVLPEGTEVELSGVESQKMTIVLQSAKGCVVQASTA